MSWLFGDSFDHYADSRTLEKWTGTNASCFSIGAWGRNGTNGLRYLHTNTSGGGGQSITLPQQTGYGFFGTALKHNVDVSGARFFLHIGDGISMGTGWHLLFQVTNSGVILVYNGGGTLLATSSGALLANNWYYVEIGFFISDTVGYCEVKVDGATQCTFSGDTKWSSTQPYWRQFILSQNGAIAGGTYPFIYDDLYIINDSGARNNTFLGDVVGTPHYPTGPGTYAEWTRGGTDSGANWSQMDETAANGDTDYVLSAAVGSKDLYEFEAFKNPGRNILAVQSVIQARKTEAGLASVGTMYRISSTDFAPASGEELGFEHRMTMQTAEENPATDLPWTETGFNNLEAGPYKTT
jgi:hypothetical protein